MTILQELTRGDYNNKQACAELYDFFKSPHFQITFIVLVLLFIFGVGIGLFYGAFLGLLLWYIGMTWKYYLNKFNK